MTRPIASIVVPAYNSETTLGETLRSLLAQTFEDFEIIVVDDGSTDRTEAVAAAFDSSRVRIVSQENRGLAGARNTGIHHARGIYVGFCDADDLWVPEKLERHVAHLEANPQVGLSYAGSAIIDGESRPVGISQTPKLTGMTAVDVFCRNPVGNGSAAVFRREALDALAHRPFGETERDWWFDETFRQSEDIEAWMRLALTADWEIEGIEGDLTLYRVHAGGLSANVERQFASWSAMRAKVAALAPAFEVAYGERAAAYQYRYLARRAVRSGDGVQALRLATASLKASRRPMMDEPVKTATTFAAAIAVAVLGKAGTAAINGHVTARSA